MFLDTLAAMDPAILAAFVGTGILLNLTPGNDVMFAMASGLRGGWRAGVAAAAGISLGSFAHATFAAIGLAAFIAASPQALVVFKWLGACYLLWLAYKSWIAPPMAAGVRGTGNYLKAARQGFVTNLLNPKVALFILALLPQFTTAGAGPVWQQILILGAIFATTGMFITSAYGALAGLASSALERCGGILNRLAALVFGGLAVRLLAD